MSGGESAFSTPKKQMVEVPVLAYLDTSNGYILDTDASADGASSVLSQCLLGQEQVVAFYSKTFSSCQRNYCVIRRQLYVIILAVCQFSP